MNRVLIVEDEARFAQFLERGLTAHSFVPTVAKTGAEAQRLARANRFDLVLLDLGLPDVDGTDLLRSLRGAGTTAPVIILTAREDVRDKIVGLDAGANDYVTKPFSFDELLARIRVQMRASTAAEVTVLTADTVSLDLRTRRATVGDVLVELTAREFTMLEVFLRHRGQVLSREQLLSQVWGYGYDPGSNVVEVYIGRLRRKLGSRVLKTSRGMGYSVD